MNGDPASTTRSKVLDDLKSRYTCIHEPLPPAASDSASPGRYLTSLRVFSTREVEEPQSPLPSSSSKPTIDPNIIKEKVTSALKALSFREPRVLVQFWSPVAVLKRCLLTTLDQPFGLGVVDEGLYLYRSESEQRVFVVDGEHREELGPPGRVYRQKLPEWSLDVHGLSTRQDWAAYNIHGYINLPVFEPISGCCVGVLEIITSLKYKDYAFEVRQVAIALKEENLKSPNMLEDTTFHTRIKEEKRRLELEEIFWALKMVCDIKNLPLAQTWGPCGYSSVVADSGNLVKSCSSYNRNCIGKICMSTAALPFYVQDLSMWGFHEACISRHLDRSQGVVGRSLAARGVCFCGDVSKLDEDEYPLAPYARMHGITSCLAVYLKSVEVGDEYVVELFLPTQTENEAELLSLVKTLKQQIKNVSRIQLGDVSSPQVIGGVSFNWNLESPTSTEKLEVPPLPPELENLNLMAENENSYSDVNVDVEHIEEDKPSSSVAGIIENVVLSYMDVGNEDDDIINNGKVMENDFDYSKELIRKKRTDLSVGLEEDKPTNSAVVGTDQNIVVPYLDVGNEDVDINNNGKRREKHIDFSKGPIRKRKRTDRSINLEEISEHFGKTMDEAAVSLHVSRSTLKRICRSHGIPRWPYTRTPNETDPLLKPDASDQALTTLVLGLTSTTYDPVTLTEPGNHTSTLVPHPKEPKDPPTTIRDQNIENPAANTYTFKVTYQKNTVKFPFDLSDGLEKLEKLVATRFQVSYGSFSLKYEDEDGDMILIACDNDLTASLGVFKQTDAQTVIRLSVCPVAQQNPDA